MMTVSASTDERSAILATAIEVADEYGLDLIAGVLLTEYGMVFSPDVFVTVVTARLAAWEEEDHPRDERGRFGHKEADVVAIETDASGKPKFVSVGEELGLMAGTHVTLKGERQIRQAHDRIEAALGTGGMTDISAIHPVLASQLAESVERAVEEFPAIRETLHGIVVEPLSGGLLGTYNPRDDRIRLSESQFGQGRVGVPWDQRNGLRDTEINAKGAFHPLDDAQSTFDHEIAHSIWHLAAKEQQAEYEASRDRDAPGAKFYGSYMSDKDISARFLGFDPDLGRAQAWHEDRPVKDYYPSTRQITAGLRAIGTEYGAKSFLKRDNWDGTASHDLNEGFAEWFSVRQRPELRESLSLRTRDLLENGFNRVLDYARNAKTDRVGLVANANAYEPEISEEPKVTCHGYISSEDWKALTPAQKAELIPEGDEPDARTAAAEREYVRDERGRFGEGDGGSADKNDTKFSTAADVSFKAWAQQFPKGTVFRAGSPGRINAMKSGHDLGTPDTAPHVEVEGHERINGVWVSTTAKLEYVDHGEIMAAFDPKGLPVINEGAPGDLLLSHVPAGRLIGTWTPGPSDVGAYHSRGKGGHGIEPVGKIPKARAGGERTRLRA